MPSGAGKRGVSEVLGFILVFSLVLMTIGIVYSGGFAVLENTRDGERVNNAERALDVLATNLQQIARGDAPRRATEVKLAGAKLETSDHHTLSTNSTSMGQAHTGGPVAIRFTAGTNTEIVYEAGAIIRTEPEGGVMLREPDFLFDENRTVVHYIETRGSGQSVSGSTTVLVRAERRSSHVLASRTDVADENVTFNITTAPKRAVVWERYLESEIDWEPDACTIVSPAMETVTCEFELNDGGSLYVARTRIEISID